MTLDSLPTLDVWIAFNPNYGSTALLAAQTQTLPSSGSSNAYWTECAQYVRDFSTTSGKQHYLDRSEAGTLRMTFDNRDGFFTNGSVNGTGYVLDTRLPIAVTETWMGTAWPVFYGFTDQITEQIGDQQNSDLLVQASDLLKQLSLKYMSSANFWEGYAQSASAANWYRCDATQTAVVTAATGNGTTITYTAFNNFQAGDNVTITGLQIESGASLNLQNKVIATVTTSGFTITDSAVGVSSGTGSAYRTAIIDQIGGQNGNYEGVVSFPQYGAMIYDTDGCVDISNGSNSLTGILRLGIYNNYAALDFWILGQDCANSVFTTSINSGAYVLWLETDVEGHIGVQVLTVGTVYADGGGGRPNILVNDGYWHHVGIVADSSGNLHLYADGQFISLSSLGTYHLFNTDSANALIGDIALGTSVYVDEIVFSNDSSLSTLDDEVRNRYTAGTLLQLPTNPTQTPVPSGDRIAEILCLAGFGSIVAGAVTLTTGIYYINGGEWASGGPENGYINVEPFYWDTPITTSTALDLIGEITDTDIGSFFQMTTPGSGTIMGTLEFFNQLWYGSWTPNPWTGPPGTWTVNDYIPVAANQLWTDDTTSTYNYYGPTTQVVRDDADVWMQVQVTPQAGTTEIYENTTGEERWGYSTLTKTDTLHPTLAQASSTAYFLGYLYHESLPRVQAVELRSETSNGANLDAIVGTQLGDVINFVRTMPNASTSGTYPSGVGQIDQVFVVESISLEFQADPGYLHATFTLDPYPVRS